MANLKSFFITFLLCLAIFSIIAWGLVSALTREPQPPLPLPPDETNAPADPDLTRNDRDPDELQPVGNSTPVAGETFAMVIGKTDPETEALTSLVLIKADKENQRFVLSALPTAMDIAVTGQDKQGKSYTSKLSLGELYAILGPEYIMNKAYAITGIPIDYYMFFDDEGTKRAIELLGDITVSIPYEVISFDEETGEDTEDTGEKEPAVVLESGTQTLDGETLNLLLNYYDNPGGERERMALCEKLIRGCFNKLLVGSGQNAVSKTVAQIMNGSVTNFTISDFNANIELIFKYTSFKTISAEFPSGFSSVDSAGVYNTIFDAYRDYK